MSRLQVGVVAFAASVWMMSGCPSTPEPAVDAGRDAPAPDTGVEPRDGGPDAAVRDAARPLDAGGNAAIEAAVAITCDPIAYGACTVAATCACPLSSPTPPEELAACMASSRGSCGSSIRSRLTDALAAGATVDEEAVARCIAVGRSAYDHCLPLTGGAADLPLPCLQAITLAIPLGATCNYIPYLCAGGEGWCGSDVCSPIPSTEGAPCAPVCGGGLACVDGFCAPPSAAGGWCADHGDCEAELCIGGACGAPIEDGAPCTETDRCATGATCTGGVCVRADVACPGADETCGARATCLSRAQHQCTPLGTEGASCLRDYECIDALTCDSTVAFPGTCGPRAELGESCGARSCVDELRCLAVGTSASCRAPLPLGASCAGVREPTGRMCDGGACVGGVCQPLPEAGESCGDAPYEFCAPDLFCLREAGSRTCTPFRAVGEACFDDSYCGPEAYCDASFTDTCLPRTPLAGLCDCGASGCGGPCLSGLVCVGEPGAARCAEPPRVGEECYEVCEAESFCRLIDASLCRPAVCDVVP